ncbi:MAG TPA: LPS assembly lipoprotein LptE [Hydrogenophaga sp.]|nr:LPS assembly lipoprotein LptE [Hydrogenophaga sp.]
MNRTSPHPLNSPGPLGRRSLLRGLFGAGALASAGWLTGCGFALRQTPTFAFSSLRFAGNQGTPVVRALRSVLETSGLRTLGTQRTPGTEPGEADVVLTVLQDQREIAVVGQTAAGQVRELQLRTRFKFQLTSPNGKILIEESEQLLEGDISFSETDALSKAAEQELMFQDQQSEMVQLVLRRLAAVKTL